MTAGVTKTEMVGYLLEDREVETAERVNPRGHLEVVAPGNAWTAPKRVGWYHFWTARHGDHTRFVYRSNPVA